MTSRGQRLCQGAELRTLQGGMGRIGGGHPGPDRGCPTHHRIQQRPWIQLQEDAGGAILYTGGSGGCKGGLKGRAAQEREVASTIPVSELL